MRVRTDDEVYRVDAVWLGPPRATFPWRARYVSWGIGILTFFVVLGVERWIGFGFGFFTVAWGLVITIAVTRVIGSRISHERPLGSVLAMWYRELTAPREKSASTGGAASVARIRVTSTRPRPRRSSRRGGVHGSARQATTEGPPRRSAPPPRRRPRDTRETTPRTAPPAATPPRARTPKYAPREGDGVRTPART